jgi:hypothetical protein
MGASSARSMFEGKLVAMGSRLQISERNGSKNIFVKCKLYQDEEYGWVARCALGSRPNSFIVFAGGIELFSDMNPGKKLISATPSGNSQLRKGGMGFTGEPILPIIMLILSITVLTKTIFQK